MKPEGVENEAVEQVAFADVLVVNKTDLVDEAEVEAVVRRLQSVNAAAKVLRTVQSRVDLADVINIRAFDLDKVCVCVEESKP